MLVDIVGVAHNDQRGGVQLRHLRQQKAVGPRHAQNQVDLLAFQRSHTVPHGGIPAVLRLIAGQIGNRVKQVDQQAVNRSAAVYKLVGGLFINRQHKAPGRGKNRYSIQTQHTEQQPCANTNPPHFCTLLLIHALILTHKFCFFKRFHTADMKCVRLAGRREPRNRRKFHGKK